MLFSCVHRSSRAFISLCNVRLSDGDCLDFDVCAFGQGCYGEGGAGRVGGCEEFGVDLVHSGEVADVCQQHGHFRHVLHRESSLCEDVLDVGQALTGFCLYAPFGKVACGRVDGELSADIDGIVSACLNGLAVGPDGSRSIACVYRFHFAMFNKLCCKDNKNTCRKVNFVHFFTFLKIFFFLVYCNYIIIMRYLFLVAITFFQIFFVSSTIIITFVPSLVSPVMGKAGGLIMKKTFSNVCRCEL